MQKNVLITGASRGIGREIAISFSREDCNVIINYNNSKEQADSLVEEILSSGKNAFAIKADVSSEEEVSKMFETIKEKFGGVSILINNAGVAKTALVTETSSEDYDRIFDVNMKGTFLCVKKAAPFMINEKSGAIINISSIWGVSGGSCETVYSASKAALIGFTKALAKELGPSGITVNAIAPGVILTDMLAEYSKEDLQNLAYETPVGAIGKTSDIASTAVFLASQKFITGQVLTVDGGFSL